MTYRYNYFIGGLTLLVIWLVLYFWRKDTRKEMLKISLFIGFIGLITDPIYSIDWWKSATITGTMPGIESFLFGFTVGGIAAIIYPEFSNKKVIIKNKSKKEEKLNNYKMLKLMGMGLIIFYIGFFIFHLNSFLASIPAFLTLISIIWLKRRDLILNSLISGLILVIISFAFYLIPELIFPGWLDIAWNFEILSGIKILGVVIEDLIWFFLAGLLVGPLYEYWKEGRDKNIK